MAKNGYYIQWYCWWLLAGKGNQVSDYVGERMNKKNRVLSVYDLIGTIAAVIISSLAGLGIFEIRRSNQDLAPLFLDVLFSLFFCVLVFVWILFNFRFESKEEQNAKE